MAKKVELTKGTQLTAIPEMMRRLAKLKNLKVGVLKGTGLHPNSNTATVAQVAWWNEFGTEISFGRSGGSRVLIPARPFLRTTMRENRRKFAKITKDAYEKTLKGEGNVTSLVKGVGLLAQSLVVQAIDNTLTPPNALATLLAKSPKTHPLIDTGRLRQSISFAEDD